MQPFDVPRTDWHAGNLAIWQSDTTISSPLGVHLRSGPVCSTACSSVLCAVFQSHITHVALKARVTYTHTHTHTRAREETG